MRYVDLSDVAEKIPANWLATAKSLTEELRSLDDPADRIALINRRADLWAQLKSLLAGITANKCWYCETRNDRSDNAVDHYRPKGRVAEDPEHGGYWWLAFDFRNYRFGCTYCNSRRRDLDGPTVGGKQDHFPLAEGSVRATNPGQSLDLESPLLLDPCRYADVMLLWFDDAGQVLSDPIGARVDRLAEERIRASVRAYHLDHGRLAGARRRIYLEIRSLCDRADRLYSRLDSDDARETYREIIQDIGRMIRPSAEHSVAARCAIRGYRALSPTAEMFVEKYL